jgi:hypothetical protein
MRWKLVVLTSLIASIVAFALWCAYTLGLYGSARIMARSDWRLLTSTVPPIFMAAAASFFVYRHTANRRKLQAVIGGLLTLMFVADFYFAAWAFSPDKFYIPKTYEIRHAR